MSYIPHTDDEVREMLDFIGLDSLDALFADIPSGARFKGEMKLDRALSEPELRRFCEDMASTNRRYSASFLGAGAYCHYIPSVVKAMTSRAEFSTAYTPYQAEASQGTLQAIYEFQSYICLLTGLDVANASLYDGATATVEASLLALAETRRKKILVSGALHPEYRKVLETYCHDARENIIEEIPSGEGVMDLAALKEKLDKDTGAVIVQNPGFFGCLEPLEEIAGIVKGSGALLILVEVEPMSLGLLKTPGSYGVDIAVGECQSFGLPLSLGGPYLGFMATNARYMRKIPGRLAGRTVDKSGKEGFVLTLQAREQHIRREKAASNICSNEALCALASTVYLSLMGKEGLREVAALNTRKAHYAFDRITSIKGFSSRFKAPFFNEFVVKCPVEPAAINRRLEEQGICGGFEAGRCHQNLGDCMILAVTELASREDIDRLAAVFKTFER